MKKIIFLYFFHIFLNAETTIPVDSLFSIGNRYYSIEKYDYALDAYLAILEDVENPDLYFNIGNTYVYHNRNWRFILDTGSISRYTIGHWRGCDGINRNG